MKRLSTFIILLLSLAASISAQITFKAEIGRRQVYVGEKFQIAYTLENATSASGFNAPEVSGCKVVYVAGPMTFNSMSNINGHVTRSQGIRYAVTYAAAAKGNITIPSATVESGGKKYTSNSIGISVSDAPADPYGMYGGYGSGSSAAPRQQQQAALKDLTHNDVFVRMTLNKTSVYEQEAIECRITLYSTAQATNLSYNTTPKIDGFLIEDASPTGNVSVSTVTEGGRTLYVYLLRKYILFPQKTGELTINSGEYEIDLIRQVQIRQGFYTYAVPQEDHFTTRSVTKTINVKALPSPRPEGFTGGVGTFKIDTELTPDDLATNQLGRLTYHVSGTGNIKYMDAPWPSFPATFEVDDKPETESSVDISPAGNNVTGEVTWTYEFVPGNVGDFTINAGRFVYFDPAKAEYVTIELPEYKKHVAKGADSDVSSNELLSHEEMKDILPAVIGDHTPCAKSVSAVTQWWYWCIWIALTVALAVTVFAYRKQVKLRADVAGRKRARANKIVRRRFKLTRRYMQQNNREQFYDEMLRAMWGYMSDKLSIPGSQLTRENVSQRLAEHGVDNEDITRFVTLVDDLELARYTPESETSNINTLYNHGVEVINAMENVKNQAK